LLAAGKEIGKEVAFFDELGNLAWLFPPALHFSKFAFTCAAQ